MDLMKILETVKLQLIIVVVLGLISSALTYVAFTSGGTVATLVGGPLLMFSAVLGLVGLVVVIWAGYVAAKTLPGGAVEGGIAGVLIVVINAIIQGIISMLMIAPLTAAMMPPEATAMPGVSAMVGMYAGAAVIGAIIFGAIFGFILGAIGGFIAGMK